MASRETAIRRRVGLDRLLSPSWLSLSVLGIGGALLGHCAWLWLPYAATVYLSGLLAPLCTAVAVAAWAMRDKADQTFEPDHLDAKEYSRSRKVVEDVRLRSLVLSAVCLLCAAAVAGPAFSAQLVKAYWHGMVLAAGAGIGLTGYAFQVAYGWESQLRRHRQHIILESKRAQEMRELEARWSGPATRPEKDPWGAGWRAEQDASWQPAAH